MYGHDSGTTIAGITTSGVVLGGYLISWLTVGSIIGGVAVIGTTLFIAYRRTRRSR